MKDVIPISNSLKNGATSHHLTLRLFFKSVLALKVNLGANAILAVIEILQVKFIDPCAFDALLVRNLYGVTCLEALFCGRVHRVVDVVVVQFNHIPVLQDFYRLHDDLVHSQSVVRELDLEDRLVVLVVDLKRRSL